MILPYSYGKLNCPLGWFECKSNWNCWVGKSSTEPAGGAWVISAFKIVIYLFLNNVAQPSGMVALVFIYYIGVITF